MFEVKYFHLGIAGAQLQDQTEIPWTLQYTVALKTVHHGLVSAILICEC